MNPRFLPLIAATLLTSTLAAAAPVAVVNAGFEQPYTAGNLPAEYAGIVPPGAFPVGGPPTGWTAWYSTGSAPPGAFVGVLNPGNVTDDGPQATFFPDGAPEGSNAVLLYHDDPAGGPPYGVYQVLADTVQPNTTYTLTVQVGNIGSGQGFIDPWLSFGYYGIEGFPGYRVELRAGGQLLASDVGSLTPGEGQWALSTVQLTTSTAHPQEGQNLEIWLVSLNGATAVPGQRGVEVDFDDVQLDASPSAAPVPVHPLGVAAAGFGLLVAGSRARRRSRRA